MKRPFFEKRVGVFTVRFFQTVDKESTTYCELWVGDNFVTSVSDNRVAPVFIRLRKIEKARRDKTGIL